MARTATSSARRPKPTSSCRSISTAPATRRSPPASASSTTCSRCWPGTRSIDLNVKAEGDLHVDQHHTVEDVGICFGQALKQALGDKSGIRRYGHFTLPMEETLATTAIDLSGRYYLVFKADFPTAKIGEFDSELVEDFWQAVRGQRPVQPARHRHLRPQQPPHQRSDLQGHRPRPADGRRDRPPQHRRAEHQGHALARTIRGRLSTERHAGVSSWRFHRCRLRDNGDGRPATTRGICLVLVFMTPPHLNFLLTNDDGIDAPGIAALREACREWGTAVTVAPDRHLSGCSHQATTSRRA